MTESELYAAYAGGVTEEPDPIQAANLDALDALHEALELTRERRRLTRERRRLVAERARLIDAGADPAELDELEPEP